MANTDAAFGMRPVGHLDGSPYNGKVNMYLVPSGYGSTLFVGDPVQIDGEAGPAGTVVNGIDCEGMPTLKRYVAGCTCRGVIVSFLPLQSDLTVLHGRASEAGNRIALVCDAPDVVFEIQEDSDTSFLRGAEVGENADLIAYAAGNTTTGRSIAELDSNTHTAAAATLRILGLSKRPGNAMAASFAKWLVVFAEHDFKSATGGE
jgi:hypothetical protein